MDSTSSPAMVSIDNSECEREVVEEDVAETTTTVADDATQPRQEHRSLQDEFESGGAGDDGRGGAGTADDGGVNYRR